MGSFKMGDEYHRIANNLNAEASQNIRDAACTTGGLIVDAVTNNAYTMGCIAKSAVEGMGNIASANYFSHVGTLMDGGLTEQQAHDVAFDTHLSANSMP